jgi:hypothetical protein
VPLGNSELGITNYEFRIPNSEFRIPNYFNPTTQSKLINLLTNPKAWWILYIVVLYMSKKFEMPSAAKKEKRIGKEGIG